MGRWEKNKKRKLKFINALTKECRTNDELKCPTDIDEVNMI